MNFQALNEIGMELFAAVVVVSLILIILAFKIKTIRKAAGVALMLIAVVISLTGIGAIIGIPLILIGGIFIFGKF